MRKECKYCNSKSTRFHSNHKTLELEYLCEKHYKAFHPTQDLSILVPEIPKEKSFKLFLNEKTYYCHKERWGNMIEVNDFYKEYEKYCKKNKLTLKSFREVRVLMREYRDVFIYDSPKNGITYWVGIRWLKKYM